MTPETKHHLIIGGSLIVAVVVGIVAFKRYQANASSDQGASDQQNADQLALLESEALNNPYASFAGGGSSISIPSAPAGPSLLDQLKQLEQAFGFAPSTPGTTGSGPTPAPMGSGSGTGSSPSVPGVLGTPGGRLPQPPARSKIFMDNALPEMKLEHEAFVE